MERLGRPDSQISSVGVRFDSSFILEMVVARLEFLVSVYVMAFVYLDPNTGEAVGFIKYSYILYLMNLDTYK
jgi:hypothetical protein